MRDEQRQVQQRRQDGASPKVGSREQVCDRRSTQDTKQGGRRRGQAREHQRLSQLRVAAKSRHTTRASGDDEFDDGCGEEEQQQRSTDGRQHGEHSVPQPWARAIGHRESGIGSRHSWFVNRDRGS
jgi:hypothetical protein